MNSLELPGSMELEAKRQGAKEDELYGLVVLEVDRRPYRV